MPALLLSLLAITITGPLLAALRPHRSRASGLATLARVLIAMLVPALVTLWQLAQIPAVAAGAYPTESYIWVAELGLELSFRLDGLSLLFGLIVTGVGAAIALYTGFYFEGDERQGSFYALLFLFMASMLGLVWTDNLLALFAFWEGTSITSYLLIAFKTTSKTAREGARRALIVTELGGLALLAGLILLGSAAGTYSLSAIVASDALTQHPLYLPTVLLIALGAFTKSAQFPFHFWLPGAMAAPTPASAYLHSATMVKAGIFLLARLHPVLSDTPLWFWLLGIVGASTMVLGAASALRYRDLKAMLAYATVSQLGALTLLLALPVEGAPLAVAVGVLAHSLYKGPLFMAAGIIDHATGTRDLSRLAGLGRALPWVAATVIVAGLSMAGVPPLLGFVGKELLLESAQGAGAVILGAALLSAALTAALAFTLMIVPFFGRAPANPAADAQTAPVHHAPAFAFVLPALILAALGALLPWALAWLGPALLVPAAQSITGAASAHGAVHPPALWHGWTPTLFASLGALAAGLLIFAARLPLAAALNRAPPWLSGQIAFAAANDGLYRFARGLTRAVQGGTMGAQMSVTLLAAATVTVAAALGTDWASAWSADLEQWIEDAPPIPEIVLALMAIVAALATVRARNRLGAIISLGVVGVTVTLYFIFFSAPDLALTQLLIEVLTVVLLVLVFFRVGPDKLPPVRRRVRAAQLFVAGMMGVFGAALVLINTGIQVAEPISPYFERFAVPEGQGGNIVNVILVDFRGYDTMGEITVLALAAVGGYALLRAPRMAALRARLVRRLSGREEGAP